MNQLTYTLSLLYCLFLLCACTQSTEQDYPKRAEQSLQQLSSWQYTQERAQPALHLTDLIQIEPLNLLINQAMQHNINIKEAQIALEIAYADQGMINSERFPQLTGSLQADKSKGHPDPTYKAGLNVSWEIDLWNKIGTQNAAALKRIEGQQALLAQTKATLAANIMRTWLNISKNMQLIEIEQSQLSLLDRVQTLLQAKYRAGLGTLDELDTAQANTYKTRAALLQLQTTLTTNKLQFRQLLGSLDIEDTPQFSRHFPDVLLPLVGLPAQDLARRPDVQLALANLEAEAFNTKVAYRALLPAIRLDANLTDSDSSLSEIWFSHPVWAIVGQLTAPLFKGGLLRKQAAKAQLTQEKNYWQYQDTLIQAVSEVDVSLINERSFAEQQQAIAQALLYSKRNFDSYQQKYKEGIIDLFTWLHAQQNMLQNEQQLVDVQHKRLINRIDLGLALGLGIAQ